ncbi:MAG TPA: MiaB/RimO family radical SAM methylthiotransferase [Dongiaceae bacterium]|nr:MiaB/RimO family radical SAM methylthiotransferase [Dongiaceae bacterium]
MPTFRVVTLGCKLNQADSAALEAALRRLGLTRAGGDADLVVLNTCTVTGAADREARQIARRLRRSRPETRLIVTGCYAERDAAALAAIAGVDQVVGMRDQATRVAALAARAFGLEAPAPARAAGDSPSGLPAALDLGRFGATDACEPGQGDHTRAFLKIQDGCDLRCAYCVIPSVRGASRSLPAEEILARLRRLAAGGLREIVFTGVNSGDWGRDLDPPGRLHDLLPRALEAAGPARLRLNSLEPRTVTPEIAALLESAHGRLARHVQIPLQSGCDAVLARMRRNYRTADYARVVGRLAGTVPEAALGADLIVGFPGETDAEFEATCRFVEASPLAYLHVFSYSPRPGTPAATMPGQVAPALVRERSARLRAMAAALSLRFRRRFVGRTLEAIVLQGSRPDGRIRALTDNYIDLWLDPGGRAGLAAGTLTSARVTAVDAGDTLAEAA